MFKYLDNEHGFIHKKIWDFVKNPLNLIFPVQAAVSEVVEAGTGIPIEEQFLIAGGIAAGIGAPTLTGGVDPVPSARPIVPGSILSEEGEMPFSLVTGGGGISVGGAVGSLFRDVALPLLQSRVGLTPGAAGAPVGAVMAGTGLRAGVMGAAVQTAGSMIRNILARASATIGKRITRKNAVALVKRIGLEAAALALGISILEMAQVVASAPTRRARGISGGDMKRTRRTLRKINSLACQLQEFCGTSRTKIGKKRAVC